MKVLLMVVCLFAASVSNGQTAVVTNPNTGKATVVHKNSNGVTTTQTSNGGTVKTTNGVGWRKAPMAPPPSTRNRQCSCRPHEFERSNHHQTTNGGKAKTKNGMGVAQGPGGTTCVKGPNNQGCKK